MQTFIALAFLVCAGLVVDRVRAACVPVKSSCKCREEVTNKDIDLTGLANREGQAALTATQAAGQQINTFAFNPCLSFSTNSSSCESVALCELNSLTGGQYALGYQGGAEFAEWPLQPEHRLALLYQDTNRTESPRRTVFIALTCDLDARVAQFNYVDEGPPGKYYFNLTTACACPGGCSEEPAQCQVVKGGRNCSCTLRNAMGQSLGLVDILSLNDPPNPLVVHINAHDYVLFNPCSDIEHYKQFPSNCNGLAVCLVRNGQLGTDFGRAYTGTFSGNIQSDAVLTYTSQDGSRSTVVTLVCDPDQRHSPALRLGAPLTGNVLALELRSACACVGGCPQTQVTCTPQSDDCSCKMSQDLGTFTLQDLNNPKAPLHAIGPDLTDYYYNPCSNITISGPNGFCKDVAGCMVDQPTGLEYALGLQSVVSFRVSNFDPNVVTLMYTGGSQGKSIYLEAHCNPIPDQLTFKFTRAAPSAHAENAVYYFYLESDHACPRV